MKLKSKKGFTLVECVVAMAVLSIMSLLLVMLLNVIITTRNGNMQAEKELDDQIADVVQNDPNPASMDKSIEFKQKTEDGGETVIDAIPKDGDEHMEAKKVNGDGEIVEVDAIKYDFSKYDKFEDIKKGKGESEDPDNPSNSKVYGAAETSYVQIFEDSVTNGSEENTKHLKLRISYDVSSYSENPDVVKSVKVTLPADAKNITIGSTQNAMALLVTGTVIRVQPTSGGKIEAVVAFDLSNEAYENEYKNVNYYYKGIGEGSPAQLNKDVSGVFK